jgi:conjugal transfer pilus assembly protein TraF
MSNISNSSNTSNTSNIRSLRDVRSLRSFIRFVLIFILSVLPITITNSCFAKGFFNERYKGWYWFDSNDLNNKNQIKEKPEKITPEEAREENRKLKKALDDLRQVMIARPTPLNVLKYQNLEEYMWKRALDLDKSFRKVKFAYPEHYDKLTDPTNVHAVKLKRKLDNENNENKIRQLSNDYTLVFFANNDCPYCKAFAPVLKTFGERYNFQIEEVSTNGELSGYFAGKKLSDLAAKLNITAFPTTVLVSKDGSSALELIRGYVSISELEEYSILALDYIKEYVARNLAKGTQGSLSSLNQKSFFKPQKNLGAIDEY